MSKIELKVRREHSHIRTTFDVTLLRTLDRPAMTEQEIATMKAHVGILKDIPVVLPNDYAPDPAGLPRKFISFPVSLSFAAVLSWVY